MNAIQMAYFTTIIIDLVCLVIFIRKGIQRRKNKIMFIITINILLSVTVLFIDRTIDNYSFRVFSRYTYHILHCMFPFIFFLYVVDLIGRWYDIKKYKTFLMLLPVLIFYVMIIINPFTDFAFYFENGEYNRSYGVYFEYLVAAFYMVCGVYWIIKYRKAIGKNKTIDIIIFLILITTGVLIQLINKEVRIELFLTSVGLISIGCNIENRDQIVNTQTDCYNTQTFISDNEQYIRAGFNYKLIIIDIQSFNILVSYEGINAISEQLLKMGNRLKSLKVKNDTVYYINSGTFIYLTFDTISDKLKIIEDALNLLIDESKFKFDISLLEINVPSVSNSVNEILTVAKKLNTKVNKIKVLDNSIISKIKRETLVEKAIRYAINNDSLKVVYQPIIEAKTGRVHSLEALTRITDPNIGPISPDEFIKVAEDTGLIFELSEKIFENVVIDISKGEFINFNLDHVAVNISRLELNKQDLADVYNNILSKYNVNPNIINIEITETHQNEDNILQLETFKRLKKMGFNFSLDDYGTGLSNISSIYELDFEIVKLDKSILWNSVKSEGYKAILDNNISILHNLKFKLVCEGVETKEQVDYLVFHNVEYLQGYYFSKPIDYDNLIEYIKNKNI